MPDARRSPILAGLAFLIISTSALRAQQGGVGSIIGELHLSRGDFPGRIYIELQFRGATITSGYSDDEGKFGFSGLGSNPYHVVIHDEHFNPVDQLVVLDTSISTMSMAQITLTPREPVRREPVPNQEQGGNPYLIDPAEYRQHFPKNAIKEFDKAIEADKNQKRDEAIRHYEQAVRLAPDFYPAHNNLGSDYLSNSDFKSAEAEFRKVIRTNPADAAAYFNLAHVFLLTKRYQESLEHAIQGLRREPNSAFGYFVLGSAYQRAGDAAQSERALRLALKLDPKLSAAHLALVNLYLSQHREAEVSAELRTFLRDFPDDAYAAKARSLLQKMDRREAKNSNPK
jgi:Flp pilus assembly protein TadD